MERDPQQNAAEKAATRLLLALIAKTLAETLFLGLVVALAAFTYFNPALRGEIETVDATRVEGWVYDPLAPNEPLVVQLFVDDQCVASARANTSSPAGARNAGHHGFQFPLANKQFSPGRHRAQVYVVRKIPRSSRTLLPVGKEKRTFAVTD